MQKLARARTMPVSPDDHAPSRPEARSKGEPMKRIFILTVVAIFLSVHTGCQSGPFAAFSKSFLASSDNGTATDDLAAYRQRVRPAVPTSASLSGPQPSYVNQPLGYRRGNQPCTT